MPRRSSYSTSYQDMLDDREENARTIEAQSHADHTILPARGGLGEASRTRKRLRSLPQVGQDRGSRGPGLEVQTSRDRAGTCFARRARWGLEGLVSATTIAQAAFRVVPSLQTS